MSLLIDLFGYLSILLHGITIGAQSMAVGGTLFLVAIARPLASSLPDGPALAARTAAFAGWSAVVLVLCQMLGLAMQAAVLIDTVGLSATQALTAQFALSDLVKAAASAGLAVALLAPRPVPALGLLVPRPLSTAVLLVLCAVVLAAAVMKTHSAARLADGPLLMAVTALHILGAAIWVGGIPFFILALRRLRDGDAFRRVGARFSRMSMVGVLCILASAAVMSWLYIGSVGGVYGTAYGVMVSAKGAMFAALLLLGLGNFLVVERLRSDPGASVLRLRRFAEVEVGIGFSIFFAAASLTSVPPAVDLQRDRVTLSEIVERNTPRPPRLVSPEYESLALIKLQTLLDEEALRTRAAAPAAAFVPGSGELPERNAADVAWSEYNHHWSGLFVMAIGALGLAQRAGVRAARHWPLMMLGLAAFLFLRSDPEVWPLGDVGFFASLRDVEVLQHKVYVVLIVAFALFEWGVRTGRLRRPGAALVFPLLTALGGALLLTHSHAIGNVKEQLLIEISHTPLALAGIGAGWSRWLELRADAPVRRIAGWVWPMCFVAVGVILLTYREA